MSLILELEGNPLFGRQHELTLEMIKRYYNTTTKKSEDKFDAKQTSVHNGAQIKHQIVDRDGDEIIKAERDLDVKQRHLGVWSKSLDKDADKLHHLQYCRDKLQGQCERLDELERRKQENTKEAYCPEHDMSDVLRKKSAIMKSVNQCSEEEHPENIHQCFLKKQRELLGLARARDLENHKRVLRQNSVEDLKEKGLYELTAPSVLIPCNENIPVDNLESYDLGFETNTIVKQNLEALKELGYKDATVTMKEHEYSFSVEIPTPDGDLSITCCGSDKNETLKKLMDELQKTLVSFVAYHK